MKRKTLINWILLKLRTFVHQKSSLRLWKGSHREEIYKHLSDKELITIINKELLWINYKIQTTQFIKKAKHLNRHTFTITTKSELLHTLGPSNFTLLARLSFQSLGLSHKEKIYYLASNEAECIKFTVGSDTKSILGLFKSESKCLNLRNVSVLRIDNMKENPRV